MRKSSERSCSTAPSVILLASSSTGNIPEKSKVYAAEICEAPSLEPKSEAATSASPVASAVKEKGSSREKPEIARRRCAASLTVLAIGPLTERERSEERRVG